MNNYEYIIASLPVISEDMRGALQIDADKVIGEILENCSGSDRKSIEFFLGSYEDGNLNVDFYRKAMESRCRFIREYFSYDLRLRNAKVRMINKALGRPEDKDCIIIGDEDGESPEEALKVLDTDDILEKERGMDSLMWRKIDETVEMNLFDLDVIMAFISKLKIIDRWLKLDPETGRILFKKLVEQIKGSWNIKNE